MMQDLISRQAAIDAMYALCDTGETLKENPWRDNPYIDAIIDALDNLPSVTPQQKMGRWIYGIDEDTGEKDLYAWTCSECEGKYPWQPKYCPNCGAKMESEEKS